MTEFSASISYNGVERSPASDSYNLNTPHYPSGGTPPRYDLLIDGYKLDAQGKQVATRARLVVRASKWKPDQSDNISQSGYFNLLAELESEDGVTFNVVKGSGFGGYQYGAPDGVFHGNLGNGCSYSENGNFTISQMSGSVTVFENTRTFQASLSFSQAPGTAEHGLSPWQCSYTCPESGGGGYNDTCHNPLKTSGSFSLNGDLGFTSPAHLDVKPIPEIISPANQDERFDYATVFPKDAAYAQIFRYTFPPYEGLPQVFETSYGATWEGKQDATTFYPDGAYPFEAETDHHQKLTKTIHVDNTPPVLGETRIVSRYGRKTVDVILEDPEVNGVRAGLERGNLYAWVQSNRYSKGRWTVAQVNLDAYRVLISATFIPNPGADDSGDYEESLVVRANDRVFNTMPETSRAFDFEQAPEAEETPLPSPTPSSACEESPLLLPEAIQPLIDDISQIQPIEPQTLNKYRQYTQQMQNTAAKLRAEGVEVPDPEPVVQASSAPSFTTQQYFEPNFRVASSGPSYDPSGNPGGSYSPKVLRLLSTYNQQRYNQIQYRNQVLSNLQSLDGNLYQLLLDSTEAYGAEYVPDEPEVGATFEEYKDLINELHEKFLEDTASSNTHSLLDATQTLANLSLMYDHLLRAMLLGQLPIGNPPTDSSQNDYVSDRLEEITQPWQLVNFTSNRLKGFRERLWNRFYPLKQEMTQLLQESEQLSYELDALDKELDALSQKAEQLGIDLPEETDAFSTQNVGEDQGFKVQWAGVLIRLGVPIVGGIIRFIQINGPRATQYMSRALGISRGVQKAITQSQRRTGSLEQELSDPNLTQAERLAKQAQLTHEQQLQSEMNGVMAMAKNKHNEAKAKQEKGKKQQDQAKANCEENCDENGEFIPEEYYDRVPTKLRGDKDGYVNLDKFSQVRNEGGRIDPKTKYFIEKDSALNSGAGSHGGSFWKLSNRQGRRMGTLSEQGKYLRK